MNETEKQNNLFLSFLQQLILGFIYMFLVRDKRQQYWRRYISSDHRWARQSPPLCPMPFWDNKGWEHQQLWPHPVVCAEICDSTWPKTRADRSMCTVRTGERSESNRCLAGQFSLQTPQQSLGTCPVWGHTECDLRPRLQAQFCCFKVLRPWICPGLSFLNFKTKLWKILWRVMRIQSKGMK